MNVQEIISKIEALAPSYLAEKWDNVGLMVGHRDMQVEGIVTTLDVTRECVDWAISQGANMIVSHHPLIFKGLKSFDLDTHHGQIIERLIKHDIAVYSAHTNLDIAVGGLNDMLAQLLGLIEVEGLVETSKEEFCKLICFVPTTHGDIVRAALATAGAGELGDYSACSFTIQGEGRFLPLMGAKPHIGSIGELERVTEERIEVIVSRKDVNQVIKAMLDVHPYEEVAYEVYSLSRPSQQYFLGRIGSLAKPLEVKNFLNYVQGKLPGAHVRYSGVLPKVVQKIALCSGAGAEFMEIAQARGADVYITGDVKYHEAQLARDKKFFLIDAGHFGTEEIVAGGLRDYLQKVCYLDAAKIVAYMDQEDYFTYIRNE